MFTMSLFGCAGDFDDLLKIFYVVHLWQESFHHLFLDEKRVKYVHLFIPDEHGRYTHLEPQIQDAARRPFLGRSAAAS